ncbi:hypothetical protein [Hymenobacter sp. IS2118]|uniref:hypothetical protein n=1 Tax=Hymenobacter sp. IS2118 TaxID=1505605 RepID=UPI001268DC76|nr:hypothetical protein [Hymenobacter sp. IS2118]
MVFRFLILLAIGLLPSAARAQFSEAYETGSYVLKSGPSERHYGKLKLRNGRKLLVRTPKGKRIIVRARHALSCTIGQRHYAVIDDLQFDINSRSVNERAGFAQLLDSGKITLLRYDHLLNSGFDWFWLYRYPITVYLIRIQSDYPYTAAWETFDGSYFRRRVRSFLISRPDLVELLDKGAITYQNFPNAIRALNHNLSFQPSAVPERKE